MNVVVIGYGRVGATLARELSDAGHQVAIVEKEADRVQRAVRLQGARVVAGNAADVQVQKDAGVGSADMIIAVTSNDNVNLVAAQIAVEVFQVSNVLARIYAPSRAEVSQTRGITTICPTRTTIREILEKVSQAAAEAVPHAAPVKRPRPRPKVVEPIDESKFVVIAGGGRVGFHLARSLLAAGHEVAMIERDPQVAATLTVRIDCPIIIGDASMTSTLDEAGAGRCRVFAAVTGRDEDNLVACQTVKTLTSAEVARPKTIARISDPNNEQLYRALGVDATVSATTLIQSVIERELPTLQIKTLLELAGGLTILELTLPEGAPVAGHPLRDVVLPRDSNVVAILRGARTVVPRGDTVFEAGDTVLTLVAKESEEPLKETLLGAAAPQPSSQPSNQPSK